MKTLRVLTWVFLVLGLVMCLGALLLWNGTRGFVARAQATRGQVVDLLEVRDSDGGSSTWKPRVTFTAPSGAEVTFDASFSSSPMPYRVGDTVDVLFAPGD